MPTIIDLSQKDGLKLALLIYPPEGTRESKGILWRFELVRGPEETTSTTVHIWHQMTLGRDRDAMDEELVKHAPLEAVTSHVAEIDKAINGLLEEFPDPPEWELPREGRARYRLMPHPNIDGGLFIFDIGGDVRIEEDMEQITTEMHAAHPECQLFMLVPMPDFLTSSELGPKRMANAEPIKEEQE